MTLILYDVKLSNLNVLSDIEDVAKIHQSETIHREPEDGMFYDAGLDMIDICGKLQVLDQMVVKLTAGGHKTLIFSQMTKMLDILGDYCNLKKWKFCRLDGSMNFIDRQDNIDKFNQGPFC